MSSKVILRGALSLGIIIIILMQVNLDLLLRTTTHFDIGLFIGAIGLMVVQIFFLSMRWHEYLNAGRVKISFRNSMFMNIAGYFANILFIASVGGILAKSGLAVRHGVSIVHALLSTFLDRFMTLATLILFSAIGLPFLIDILDRKIMIVLALCIVFLTLIVGCAMALLYSGILKDYILSSRRRSRAVAVLRNFGEDTAMMGRTVFQSIVAQACFIMAVYVLSLGVDGHHANTIEFIAIMPILALISSIPISFGGWGLREGAFIYGLGLIGFTMENAFLLSIQVGLVSLIAPFIVAIPYFLQDDVRSFLKPDKVGSKAV